MNKDVKDNKMLKEKVIVDVEYEIPIIRRLTVTCTCGNKFNPRSQNDNILDFVDFQLTKSYCPKCSKEIHLNEMSGEEYEVNER